MDHRLCRVDGGFLPTRKERCSMYQEPLDILINRLWHRGLVQLDKNRENAKQRIENEKVVVRPEPKHPVTVSR